MGKRIGAYRVLLGKPEGQRPLERSWCIREDNIKMDLQEIGYGAWTGLMWIRIRRGGSTCKGDNESLVFIK
jgi:hypothetical protein